jgi:hypothetical protein
MMFVKVYRYHIRPDKTKEFLSIQERAGEIYRKHVSYRAVYLQSQDDPGLWLEIQWCSDEAAYRRAMDLINAEPGIKKLWQEFQGLLDPEKPNVQEECFHQIRSEGDPSSA